MADENPSGWHFKKEVQLTHLLSTLTIAVGAVMYIGRIDQRIALVEATLAQQAQVQRDRDERQDRAASDAVSLVRGDIREVNSKLDRLIEKGRKP